MDFVTAEEKFNELQARIRRGEPMSEDQYQEELAQLMVQDDSGVFWSLEPGTGRWLYFNGTEWMPGMPPKQSPPPVVVAAAATQMPPASEPAPYESPAYNDAPPAAEPQSTYYAPSDATQSAEYTGSYSGSQAYSTEPTLSSSSYHMPSSTGSSLDADDVPAYVRMGEANTTNVPTGGIPPRAVREASPLAVPGGERAWLPFAFGALVLLLCAIVLFFGVRGLPQFSGSTAGQLPTEEPTEEVTDVLPTETVELEPTDAPEPTEQPTPELQPTAAQQPFTAAPTDVLNIRQGPARTTASLGKLQRGQEVAVLGRNADSTWLQIQIPDSSDKGWVSAEFVTTSGDINTLPVTSEEGGSAAPAVTETPTG